MDYKVTFENGAVMYITDQDSKKDAVETALDCLADCANLPKEKLCLITGVMEVPASFSQNM